ncbi:glycosyltransferase [Candidatus Leptofilum sp.]|uniref:glycosyltransferase n=1 Tax=Candidatus Leptofilum sp. TaxID=3241576 RepID=UPI003B5A9307
MKIALLTHKMKPPLIGGVDVYTDRLGRGLLRLGHEVVYLAFDSSGEGEQIVVEPDEHHDGTAVHRIFFNFDSLSKETFDTVYNPEMGRVTRQILAEEKPDFVIILNFYMLTLATVEAAKSLEIPVAHVATDFVPVCRWGTFMRWDNRTCEVGESVQTCASCFISHRSLGKMMGSVMEKLPEQTVVNWAEKNAGLPHPLGLVRPFLNHAFVMKKRLDRIRPLRQQIDLVLVPTRFTEKTFIENGFASQQVHFLPFGVDVDNPLAITPKTEADQVRFMFLGRLQPYKGLHLVLEAFNSLPNPNGATLTVYGAPDGHDDYFANLQQMMDANPNVHFAGLIPPTELARAFANADIFLLPSTWHENSPLILLDALQSKTPVLASDIGGVSGIVEHNRNGLLFSREDVAALRSEMQRLIDQPDLIAQLQAGSDLPSIESYAENIVEKMAAFLPKQAGVA